MSGVAYFEIPPEEDLKPFIKCFWLSANQSDSDLQFTTLPDGCLELVVICRKHQAREIILSGILSNAYEIVMQADEVKMGIRILPLGKEYYLNQFHNLERFCTFTIVPSGNLVAGLQSFAQMVTADIRQILPGIIENRKLVLFDLIQRTQGNIEVKALSQQSFWTPRQINRYFNKEFGISLKTYCNILKCYTSYSEIKAGHLNPDLGYYDQSHFIREIRKFTGATPGILMKNELQRYLQFNGVSDDSIAHPE